MPFKFLEHEQVSVYVILPGPKKLSLFRIEAPAHVEPFLVDVNVVVHVTESLCRWVDVRQTPLNSGPFVFEREVRLQGAADAANLLTPHGSKQRSVCDSACYRG